MSWSPELPIGEFRPWPDTVHVVRGRTGEMLRYVPEQAVAATLGPGTCHKLPSSGDTVCIVRMRGLEMEFGYWKCSECGCECFEGARYCMNCGRKVEA